MPDEPVGKLIGKAVRRKEDPRLISGRGTYIADMNLPGMLHMAVLRSTYAHAKVVSVDVGDALRSPGVVGVVTGPQLAEETGLMIRTAHIPGPPGKLRVPEYHALATDKVRYVGQPVAAVLARDVYAAADALERINVDYESLPVVSDPEKALESGSPLVFEEWGDNIIYYQKFKGGDTNAAFKEAPYVLKEKFTVPRSGSVPMETRGIIASYNPFTGMTLWINTQSPHRIRVAFIEILNLPANSVRILTPRDVGGSFGNKGMIMPEHVAACYFTMKTGKPVRWMEDRRENLMDTHERNQTHEMELAATREGVILGLKDRIVSDVGTGMLPTYLGFTMPMTGAVYVPNVYKIKNYDFELTCVATNKVSLSPVRAFGSFPARFAMDRLIDIVAKELDVDPAEMRFRNMIRANEFPYTNVTGLLYDSGDYHATVKKVLKAVDYWGVKKQQKEMRKKGKYIGVGLGVGAGMSGLGSEVMVPLERQPGYGSVYMKMDHFGKVYVLECDAPHGQGHETTFSQIVADELGVKYDDVNVLWGDTWLAPYGFGTGGSRGASYVASAVAIAARKLREKVMKIAAHLMDIKEYKPEEFEVSGGYVTYKKNPSKRMSMAEIGEIAYIFPTKLPKTMEPGLEIIYYFEAEVATMFAFSAHACVVEVDPSTGRFTILKYAVCDDAGRMINPGIVEGMVHGGTVMGISHTVHEHFVYDEDGQLLTTTFADYMLPTALDMPDIEVLHHDVPSPYTPLGTKGNSEGIPGPVPATLANAIEDALTPFKIKITDLPLKPHRLWSLIQQGKR